MRRLGLILVLPLLLGACGELRQQALKLQEEPYNSAWIVVPLAIHTPPGNQILFGPCEAEFAIPDSRRQACNIHHTLWRTAAPWDQIAANGRAMAYDPGQLQCWQTLGTAECLAIAGPPRPVYMIAPTMGAN